VTHLTLTGINSIQQSTCLLWQLKAHYHLHKSLPLTPTLIQINRHHALPPYLLWIHINFITPCIIMSSSRLIHSGFINKILNALLMPPCVLGCIIQKIINYKVPLYVTFSSLVLLAVPIFQIFSSTSLIYVFPLMYNTSFTLILNKQ